MAGFITTRVRLDVEIYSDDVTGMEARSMPIDVTTFRDVSPQYMNGLSEYEVRLSSAASERIMLALKRAMLEHAGVKRDIEERRVLRGIALSGL